MNQFLPDPRHQIVSPALSGHVDASLDLIEDGVPGHLAGEFAVLLPDAWEWSDSVFTSLRYYLSALDFDVLDQGMHRNGYIINFGSIVSAHAFYHTWHGAKAFLSQ